MNLSTESCLNGPSLPNISANKGGQLIVKLLLYILLLFPITSFFKDKLSFLNPVLTGITVFLFLVYYFFKRFHFQQFLIAIYIIGTFILNIVKWGFSYYNFNMLLYFPFLLLYFELIKHEKDSISVFLRDNKSYIDAILLIWNFIVSISFFMSSSYVYEGETRGFASFCGSTFLLCPTAVYVFAITLVQYQFYGKKLYIASFIISSLCILMGTSRTYLAVLLCAWMLFIYIKLDNKKTFPFIVVLGVSFFVLVVLVSPVSEKFFDTANRTSAGMDPLEAFTSGRSDFWTYDVINIFKSKPFDLVFGHGVNWLFNLNYAYIGTPLWAHNDFIQILSDYGLLGLSIYFWTFTSLVHDLFKSCHIPVLPVFFLLLMWLFNAFFNMFYTYFCASLSFPFFCLALRWESRCDRSSRVVNYPVISQNRFMG